MMGAYQFVQRERAGKTVGAVENEEIQVAFLRGVRNWFHYDAW